MIKLLTVDDIQKIIQRKGIFEFFRALVDQLEKNFSRWEQFQKTARHATHLKHGVIELMPISDDQFYAFKYVHGHPANPFTTHQQTVTGFGALADVNTGFPLFIAAMTLLTAFRTAATSAFAARYLAKKIIKSIGIIGTGAQSEFQILAQKALFDSDTVYYYDIDPLAMKKFEHNLKPYSLKLIPCDSAAAVAKQVDMITTATALTKPTHILTVDDIRPGMHINSIGCDCPNKTELDKRILEKAKIVVEYLPQSTIEGEIQQVDASMVYAELWEVVTHLKKGRESDHEITLFDSVGFALEDFSVLTLMYQLANEYNIAEEINFIPKLDNPKDLLSALHAPIIGL